MRPARLLAVTRLLLDVLDDLAPRPDAALSMAERSFLEQLFWQTPILNEIVKLAEQEMNLLAADLQEH